MPPYVFALPGARRRRHFAGRPDWLDAYEEAMTAAHGPARNEAAE